MNTNGLLGLGHCASRIVAIVEPRSRRTCRGRAQGPSRVGSTGSSPTSARWPLGQPVTPPSGSGVHRSLRSAPGSGAHVDRAPLVEQVARPANVQSSMRERVMGVPPTERSATEGGACQPSRIGCCASGCSIIRVACAGGTMGSTISSAAIGTWISAARAGPAACPSRPASRGRCRACSLDPEAARDERGASNAISCATHIW